MFHFLSHCPCSYLNERTLSIRKENSTWNEGSGCHSEILVNFFFLLTFEDGKYFV